MLTSFVPPTYTNPYPSIHLNPSPSTQYYEPPRRINFQPIQNPIQPAPPRRPRSFTTASAAKQEQSSPQSSIGAAGTSSRGSAHVWPNRRMFLGDARSCRSGSFRGRPPNPRELAAPSALFASGPSRRSADSRFCPRAIDFAEAVYFRTGSTRPALFLPDVRRRTASRAARMRGKSDEAGRSG